MGGAEDDLEGSDLLLVFLSVPVTSKVLDRGAEEWGRVEVLEGWDTVFDDWPVVLEVCAAGFDGAPVFLGWEDLTARRGS